MPKKLFIVIAVLAFVAGASACGGSSKDSTESTPTTVPNCPSVPAADPPKSQLPVVKLETSCGDIYIEMDTKDAPKAAGRFIDHVEAGTYDGLTFHRIIPGFVIQGGDPEGTGMGGTDSSVVGETPTDGYPVGSLAAAKTATDPPGTFDIQFFITTGPQGEQLPPEYARFGTVLRGLDVVKNIESVATDANDAPMRNVTINKATVSGA